MIIFDRVSKQYEDGVFALRDISLRINEGEFVSIIGKSGAGKTTLLKMLWAEVAPTAGHVYFNEDDIHSLNSHYKALHRRRIGMVFQDYRLLPHKTVFENIAFMMEVAGKSDLEIRAEVPYALDLVGLGDMANRFPHQLSEGQQQRLGIARAIIHQPEALLADEPTGNLDPASAADIISIFKKINQLGTTVVMTTHSKSIVDMLGKRVLTLEDGQIIHDDERGTYRTSGTTLPDTQSTDPVAHVRARRAPRATTPTSAPAPKPVVTIDDEGTDTSPDEDII